MWGKFYVLFQSRRKLARTTYPYVYTVRRARTPHIEHTIHFKIKKNSAETIEFD